MYGQLSGFLVRHSAAELERRARVDARRHAQQWERVRACLGCVPCVSRCVCRCGCPLCVCVCVLCVCPLGVSFVCAPGCSALCVSESRLIFLSGLPFFVLISMIADIHARAVYLRYVIPRPLFRILSTVFLVVPSIPSPQNMRLVVKLFQRLHTRPPWGPEPIASTESFAMQLAAANVVSSDPTLPRYTLFLGKCFC